MSNRTYICIDLKSFYASVECVDRGLDPLTTNLVVADNSRTEKTICLAVTPALKSFGVPGRPRLFEVIQKVKEINYERQRRAYQRKFTSESDNLNELLNNKNAKLTYIVAPPRMAYYVEVSSKIYSIYLKYIAPEDIHVYSIDEVFMDVTKYLKMHQMTAHELAITMIRDVLKETGITATAGIGTNMYLAKVAMDIVAKKMPADKDGVRIAELDEMKYRKELWNHKPLKDFWRVGAGYVKRLEKLGLYTMGDIAKCSVGEFKDFYNEDLLYKEFGINAELLIDHAWGYEPTTIEDVKSYVPKSNSLTSGQVLSCPYESKKAKLIVREMTELLSLDLVEKGLLTSQLSLAIGYDIDNLTNPDIASKYTGPIDVDYLGRKVPKGSHSSINLEDYTSSTTELMNAIIKLFDRIANPLLLVRRITICANGVIKESEYKPQNKVVQFSLFDNVDEIEKKNKEKEKKRKQEHQLQEAILTIKNKYGKNAILKGMNLEEGGTTKERNEQIGGHKS